MVKSQTVSFEGKNINVTTTGNGNKTIIFIHGNSQSANSWESQLLDTELQKHFQLIAVDLPGHGGSDWHTDAAYSLTGLAEAVETVIGYFKPAQFILCGISFGTNIIGEITRPLPQCSGIILAGACLVSNDKNPSVVLETIDALPVTILADVSDVDLANFCRHIACKVHLQKEYAASYRQTDPAFRAAVGKQLMAAGWSDEINNIARHNLPVLVVYGEHEKTVHINYLSNCSFLWQNKIHLLGEAGHLVNQDNPEAFNCLLLTYTEAVFK